MAIDGRKFRIENATAYELHHLEMDMFSWEDVELEGTTLTLFSKVEDAVLDYIAVNYPKVTVSSIYKSWPFDY